MQKIRYSKERLKSNLRIGLFFLITGIVLLIISITTTKWEEISIFSIGFGQALAGIFMLSIYYFENKLQYLTITNGEIVKNTLFFKKIKISEIKLTKEFAGDLILKTDKEEFLINTQIIEPASLTYLKNSLKSWL
ncbi:hypothetical protein CLV86_0521 [Lacinutrix venerupis]|uniref:hypothetical protein n=1 Tax=Lacinutrix venerupis TaxID=1486034 RepID=UPI000EB070A4|nr:hypothetical protein [Lacinutrix venerupis]RLJ69127.1 hypothetical protein CLV86_0521 [Lacinutrix venerupis]